MTKDIKFEIPPGTPICVDCGKTIRTSPKRLRSNPNRRCMNCHLARTTGRHRTGHGYMLITVTPGRNGERRLEHRVIAERAIGRALRSTEEIHHFNGNGEDNVGGNLVICPNRAYHALLHQRQRALEESGNPNNLKCRFCKQWDDPKNLMKYPANSAHHSLCRKEYRKTAHG